MGPAFPQRRWCAHPVTTWPIGHCTVSSEPFLGTVPARLWVGRPAGVARLIRLVPPLDHHGEPALNVVFKAPPGADPWPLEPPQSSCVLRWDFARFYAERTRHLKSHPATRGGGKLSGQSNVLPYVFAGSVVSDTLQRLWPGAHWTVAAQGPRESVCCRPPEKATMRRQHRHLPSAPRWELGAFSNFKASMKANSVNTCTRKGTPQ